LSQCVRCMQAGLCACVEMAGEASSCRTCRPWASCQQAACPNAGRPVFRSGPYGAICGACRSGSARHEWSIRVNGRWLNACSAACLCGLDCPPDVLARVVRFAPQPTPAR
jgi:hypothetical protein